MRQILIALACLSIGGSLAGCTAAGALAYKASGPPKIPAKYKPAQLPTLVLVENYENPDLYEVQSGRIERDISGALAENKVAPLISTAKLMDLKTAQGAAFHKMDIPAIAKSLGARQVIYVNLVQFSVEPPIGSPMMRGTAEALVKVIEVPSGHTVWPPDSSIGHDVKLRTPAIADDTSATGVEEQVYHKLGDKIAALFYDSSSDEVDGSEPQSDPQ